MSSRRELLLASFAALLAGCASAPMPDSTAHWSGKFILTPKSARSRRESARFRLEQSEHLLRLEVLGPMNTRVARLEAEEGEARLTQASGEVLRAQNSEALMQEALGFSLPLPLLLSWFQGKPWPQAPYVSSTPEDFMQAGWHVTILARHASGQPRRLKLESSNVMLELLVAEN